MMVVEAATLIKAQNEGPSYRAGYAAVSNPRVVRVAFSGTTDPGAFCDKLYKRKLDDAQHQVIHRDDFQRGCVRAVHDVME